ncbi:hypothetical protein SAMN04489713_111124 [Actinomadura madurae]|uniref:HNH nuclease domain-containing protein n=1 Tax=Actinomadura madurae TaxID=1993 RepID=A0A1I5M2I1_9ACTN|nr:hypothetical protein [Actinomadura madurae]SFP03557.1 hypothetical protein SAMN04489713_111124 [Actinomadura madurae]
MSTPNRPNSTKRRTLKRRLAKRDGAQCFYCAHPFGDLAEATLDHLIPFSILPTWNAAALVLACEPCNHAKGCRLPQTLMRPSGYGPGLVPAATKWTVRRAVRWTVRTVADTASWSVSWTVSSVLALSLSDGPATLPEGYRRTVPAAPHVAPAVPEVIECGRCRRTCRRDRLAHQPARWLIARPPVRAAYCWRCAAAIADELLLEVSP